MQVGNYQILNEISRGSMGVIYKAHDRALDRTVALKVMSTGGGEFAHEDQARFRREAHAMARIHHPNVVAIHGAGMANGAPYLVLDFVEGESLADRLRRGPLKPRHAAKLVRDLAAALEVAHAEGVLHRDLKPANVLIDRKGKVLLTDFGLAKNMYDGDPLTLSEMVLGTPAYMSPEQAMGAVDRIGPQSDVYGLGAILYALLTGHAPIRGTVVTEVLEKVISTPPPPPTEVASGLEPELEAIVLRCLEKEPSERYESVRQLKDALNHYLHPPRTGPGRGALLGSTALGSVLGFALGVGATLALWAPTTAGAPAPVTRRDRPPPQPQPPAPDEPTPTPLQPPQPQPQPQDPVAAGPAPVPAGDRHHDLRTLQAAIDRTPLNLPTNWLGVHLRRPQELVEEIDAALEQLDEARALDLAKEALQEKELWAKRLGLRTLARLGDVFRCAQVLEGFDNVDVVMGIDFPADGALAEILDETRGKELFVDHFTVLGGYWERDGDWIRSRGKALGPHETTALLVRDSAEPTSNFRLDLRVDVRHLLPDDAAGMIFAATKSNSYWACYVRREKSGQLTVRVGEVDKGTPDFKDAATLPFSEEVDLRLEAAPRELKVEVNRGETFVLELRRVLPQGYRGYFRVGAGPAGYGDLFYEPR